MTRPWLLSLAALVAAGSAFGQEQAPARGIWIANMRGAVSFLAAGANANTEWSPAEMNRQLVVGDQVATIDDATAELRVDTHILHLGPGSTVEFGKIEGKVLVIDLKQGSLNAETPRLAQGETFEVDTHNLSLTLAQPGNYSFELDPQGNTRNIVVRDGLCQAVSAAGQGFQVDAGKQATVSGENQVAMNFTPLPDSAPPPPEPQVGPQEAQNIPGTDELPSNGVWQPAPDNNGQAWYPNVPADWAPYTQGQWEYIEPGGWTWVDAEPWGFAPFHYGRWGFAYGRWYWVPGAPVYEPALVGWIGGGPGLSGMVGWFPLGPREPYIGFGGFAPAGYRYANMRYAFVVSHETFIGARPVFRERVRVGSDAIVHARVGGYAAIAPSRVSVIGTRRAFARPPAFVASRAVVARTVHAAPALPLERRQQQWSQAPGKPLSSQQIHSTSFGNPNVRMAPNHGPGQTFGNHAQTGQPFGNHPPQPVRPQPPQPQYRQPQQQPANRTPQPQYRQPQPPQYRQPQQQPANRQPQPQYRQPQPQPANRPQQQPARPAPPPKPAYNPPPAHAAPSPKK